MKISEPNVSHCLESSFEKAVKANSFNNGIFTTGLPDKYTISDAIFDSCIFNGLDFTNILFDNVELIDTVFENCDLSNKIFDNKLIRRVKFVNCKLTGISFVKASLQDIQIKSCKADYVNFAEAGIKNMCVDDSSLEKAYFCSTKIKNVIFNNVNFTGFEVIDSVLADIDFSTCKIDGMRSDFKSLRGIIIDKFQAYNLVQMLGVKFK